MPGKRHGKEIGAGNGNRTRIVGLGSRCLTIRRYPQNRSARSIEDFPANRQPALITEYRPARQPIPRLRIAARHAGRIIPIQPHILPIAAPPTNNGIFIVD